MATRLFPAGAPDVLYLVDVSGYVFRAYHALEPLSSPSGEPTQAVFGTIGMLERLIQQRRPTLLAVAMDSKSPTFRRQLFDGYKANRPPPPPDLSQQMERVGQIIRAFNVPVFQEEGVEADDLIASAVREARLSGLRVVIVSADKDLGQLVGDDVILWDSMRNKVTGPPEIDEKYGVRVDQLRDLQALMGDSSDNVPGVPSVGPKTARDLLVQFGTLEAVLEGAASLPRKALREALLQHRDQALLSQKLVTLKDDCVLAWDVAALHFGARDLPALRAIYQELGFHRLREQLESLPGAESAEPATGAVPASDAAAVELLGTVGELEAWVARHRSAARLGLELELSELAPHQFALAGVALAADAGHGAYVPVHHADGGLGEQATLEALRPLLEADVPLKDGHDLKRMDVALSQHGVKLRGLGLDTRLAAYLLDPEGRRELPDLAEAELGLRLGSRDELTGTGKKRAALHELPAARVAAASAPRAAAALAVGQRLLQRLTDAGLDGLYRDVELPLSRLLADMERTGVLVDGAYLGELAVTMDRELVRLEAAAHAAAGRAFNVGSPRQLEAILFDELGLSPQKRTKTSRSTDAETLEALEDKHPLPGLILQHRQIAKLKGTYVDALPALVRPSTGRIHTTWEQTVAATGRLSSIDPNLQNIPIRSELGRDIRRAFRAPPGHQLVSADYSQIELRVLAHLSRDPVLVAAFRAGEDVHLRTAMEIFEVSADEVDREMRTQAKAVNFGVIYGQGDAGLSRALGISRAEASSFIAAYFRRYEGVRRFMDDVLTRARAGEAVGTLLGRRRFVPDIASSNRARRLAAERMAMNMPIQGTAADILKLAMLALAEPVTPGARMVLTVHDELVFEVPDEEVAAAKPLIAARMAGVIQLDVPLEVDVGHGPDWKAAH